MQEQLEMSYHVCPANKDLHKIRPIRELFDSHIAEARAKNEHAVIVDPFARNCTLADFSNDLDINTLANFHMDAADFLLFLYNKGIRADVIIFDPPFSAPQNKKTYKSKAKRLPDTIVRCKQIIPLLMKKDGVVMTSGWTANGVGTWRGFKKEKLIVINHAYNRYATNVLVERKIFDPIHLTWKAYAADKRAVKFKNNSNKMMSYLMELTKNN